MLRGMPGDFIQEDNGDYIRFPCILMSMTASMLNGYG